MTALMAGQSANAAKAQISLEILFMIVDKGSRNFLGCG